MKTFRLAATTAILAASLFGAAPSALANSFDDDTLPDGGRVWYTDGTDTLCGSAPAGYRISFTVSPVVAGRGPTLNFSVAGGKQCKSLATAYEDTKYTFSAGIIGPDDPCRCATRFTVDDFYS